jgi:hypothetical protein
MMLKQFAPEKDFASSRVSRIMIQKAHPGRKRARLGWSVSIVPERRFEYFPSPESSDDDEVIAYLFLHCSVAVDEWPRFRRELEVTAEKSSEQCDHIETNAIDIFREVRDTIASAINTNNMALMAQPRLLDRLLHAHAFMALHADPASLAEYQRSICPQIDKLPGYFRPDQGDFNKAVWEGKWNSPGDQMPAEVTYRATLHNRWIHEHDGRCFSGGRLDPVAKAMEQIEPLEPAGQVGPLFRANEPHYKPPDEQSLLQVLSEIQGDEFLTPMNGAFTREGTRQLFLRAGVKPKHASFGVRIVHDGAKQRDNPTAWKAIYRKRGELWPEVLRLFDSR